MGGADAGTVASPCESTGMIFDSKVQLCVDANSLRSWLCETPFVDKGRGEVFAI